LVVCTANRCRSPLAGGLLRATLAERGQSVEVETAGLGPPGFPATDETITVAARRGLDLRDLRSEGLAPASISRADLVLAMERRHLQEIVVTLPSAWPRTFTLKEVVRRGETAGPRQSGELLASWLARVHEQRERRDLMGASPLDDVTDPTGGTVADHEDLARELEDLVGRLADLLRPGLPPIRWSGS